MKKLLFLLFSIYTGATASAVSPAQIRWHDETSDTTAVQAILERASKTDAREPQDYVSAIGREFLGKPYVAHTLEGETEMLTVNLDELDCTTYVETVLALAKTAGEHRKSWRDFIYNLETIRYRGGTMKDYGSRLHYISDWIIDNGHRGNVQEVSNRAPRNDYVVKTLDFMSAHRDAYPALKDSAQYARIIDVERGYRSHRFPYIKTNQLQGRDIQSWLREGDVVCLTTKTKGLDVSHLGILTKGEDGEWHLMHASSSAGKVIVDPLPFYEYLRRSKTLTGFRVLRLKD